MTVEQAEAKVAAAETAVQTAQQQLKKTQTSVQTELKDKKQASQDARRNAASADKKANKASERTDNQLDKAAAQRKAQRDARDNVKGPAIFEFGKGRGKKHSEMSIDQLKEKRSQAARLKKLMAKNAGENPTARQTQYMHGQQAKIHEINAELNRRKAEDARDDAEKAQEKADEARDVKKLAQKEGAAKVAAAQTAVAEAQANLATARECLKDAQTAARQSALEAKEKEIADLQAQAERLDKERERIKQDMKQTAEDIFLAAYFAKQLGLTDDSFNDERLEAWKQQMKCLQNFIDGADDADLLPPGLSEAAEAGTELLPLLLSKAQDDRIRQMEWEMQDIDLGLARYWMSNKTAKEWMADDKHGDNAIKDDEQTKRVMRIIVGWAKNGSLDTGSLLGHLADAMATVEGERNAVGKQLHEAKQSLIDLMGATKAVSATRLDAAFVLSAADASWAV